MKYLILAAALFLMGCGGLDGQSVHYLRKSQDFQTNLQTYQRKLKEVAAVPPEARGGAARALLAEVEADHKKLAELEPSEKVKPVHKELDQLYVTMEEFIQFHVTGKGDPKALSKQWAEHLDKMQVELQRLGP